MGIFDYFRTTNEVGGVKAKAKGKSPIGIWMSSDGEDLACRGYTSLADNPEVYIACRRIAMLISSMPIMLMENGDSGDIRIFNELSRKVDIEPNKNMTRRTWMEAIVMNMLLHGKGNAVVQVKTQRGYLANMTPVPASQVSFNQSIDGKSYVIYINGKAYKPDDVLHFVDNPNRFYPWKGQGITVLLKDVANNLKQAAATKKGFMSSKWKPSVIVKVDSLTDEMSDPEKRKQLMAEYVQSTEAGEPWLIPADQFDVEVVKPLSLADLAIADGIEIDKRTVAMIIGVPPFLLGVGEYDKDAWNNWISSWVKIIAQEIEQELTKKLIMKPEWYWKFNILSLMDWDIKTIADVFGGLSDKGFITGNEVRDRIGMSPLDGLDELRILENYIPMGMIGQQGKLIQDGGGDDA